MELAQWCLRRRLRRARNVAAPSSDSEFSTANVKTGRRSSPCGVASATNSPPSSMARARRSFEGIVSAPRAPSVSVARRGSRQREPRITPAGGPSCSPRGRSNRRGSDRGATKRRFDRACAGISRISSRTAHSPPSAEWPSPFYGLFAGTLLGPSFAIRLRISLSFTFTRAAFSGPIRSMIFCPAGNPSSDASAYS